MAKETDKQTAIIAKLQAEAEGAKAEAERAQAEARKTNAEAAQAEIELVREQRKEREELARNRHHFVYYFNDPVSHGSVNSCLSQLAEWSRTSPGQSLEIIFTSPGGDVIAGMALFDYIVYLRSKGHEVTTVALGWAASMAGILLQAGDKRVMGRESYVLIHEISTGAVGKIGEIEDEVKFVKKIQKRVLDIFASRAKVTRRYFASHWKRKDWWLDSDECLKIGFVDEVR